MPFVVFSRGLLCSFICRSFIVYNSNDNFLA